MALVESIQEVERYLNKYGYGLEVMFRAGKPQEDQYRVISKRPNSTFNSKQTYDLGDLKILCQGIRLCRDHFQTILNDRP